MSAEDNKAIIRGFYREIDSGNLEAMDELVAETTSTLPQHPSRAWG